MRDVVCAKRYDNRIEAEMAKGFLESNSIEAIVSADDAGGMRPHLLVGTAVRLLVKQEDIAKARQLLENIEREQGTSNPAD